MKRKILVTGRDVGAAVNVIEIINVAKQNANINLHLYLQPPASRYFSQANIAHERVPAKIAKNPDDENASFLLDYAEKILTKVNPDIILTGLSTPGDAGIDEAMVKVAKNRVPTVVMQDFWGAVNRFFGVCADYHFCLDEEAKHLTEKKCQTEGFVIGSPKHSRYKFIDIKSKKLQLRKAFNLNNSNQVLGLFGQALDHLPGYQETLSEFLHVLQQTNPDVTVFYRPHPRETAVQAEKTINLLKQLKINFFIADHERVEHSLLLCDAVCNILSNCLYDSCYLNFFAQEPLITPIALCYKNDILQHLKNFNMLTDSPYRAKNIAYICDAQKPDAALMEYLLSKSCKTTFWAASKKLENPQLAAEKALKNLIKLTE